VLFVLFEGMKGPICCSEFLMHELREQVCLFEIFFSLKHVIAPVIQPSNLVCNIVNLHNTVVESTDLSKPFYLKKKKHQS